MMRWSAGKYSPMSAWTEWIVPRTSSSSSWRITSNFGRYADHSASRRNRPDSAAAAVIRETSAVVQSDRLLHERVPAGGQGEQGVVDVEVMGCGDVDDVDLRVADELLVRAVAAGLLDTRVHGEGVRRLERSRADRIHLLPGVPPHRPDEPAGDPPGPEDAPPQRRGIHRVRGAGRRKRRGKRHRHRPGCSVVLGEAEVEAAVAGVEPARGDDLAAGEEVDALDAVRVGVAESEFFQPPNEK